jgi:hypothetical protein
MSRAKLIRESELMPTESLYRLIVEGEPSNLLAFRKDDARWAREPWSALYGSELDDSDGRLAYRYNDDYKRPAPESR